MTLNLDDLEATAKAATPGPWSINWETDEYHAGMPDKWALSINGPEASDFADLAAADAEHMATFDPPTVLALIAKLREAEAVTEKVRALVEPPKPFELGKSMMRSFDRMIGDLRKTLATYKPTNQEGNTER